MDAGTLTSTQELVAALQWLIDGLSDDYPPALGHDYTMHAAYVLQRYGGYVPSHATAREAGLVPAAVIDAPDLIP